MKVPFDTNKTVIMAVFLLGLLALVSSPALGFNGWGVSAPFHLDTSTGACCTSVGTCTVTFQTGCQAPDIWQGASTTCSPSPCLMGACCKYGVCSISGRLDCEDGGGIYRGNGALCAPRLCVPPQANFAAEPLSGTAPLLVHFRYLSPDYPDSWRWDFDMDGAFESTDPNPDWTYTTPGEQDVKLVVSNAFGADSLTRPAYIGVTPLVRFVGVSSDSFPVQSMPPGSNATNGAAWCDYDGDGSDDLFVCHPGDPHSLFHNNGDGVFTRVLDQPPGMDALQPRAATWGDYDNDGKPDLFIANWDQPNVLYRNLGDGQFARVSLSPLTTDLGYSACCAWADMDGDGWLDLFVGNEKDPYYGNLFPDFLYRNNGDGSFTRVTDSGLLGDHDERVSAQWVDIDNDGDPDLAVAAGYGVFTLYTNDGSGHFEPRHYDVIYACDVTSGDYDNDGFIDLILGGSGTTIMHNNAGGVPGQFELIVGPIGSNGASFADFDNDGFVDVLTVCHECLPHLFNNLGDGTFGTCLGVPPVMDPPRYYGSSAGWADADGDGRLDLFYGCRNGSWACADILYRNVTPARNWLSVLCEGTVSNRSAFGAKVRVKASIGGGPSWQLREVTSSSGGFGQGGFSQHFGLADATIADSVVAQWPSGLVTTLVNVSANQAIVLTEPHQTVAQFVGEPTGLRVHTSVSFRDRSLGEPTSWGWDMDGDGQDEATDRNPTYTYDTAGLYSVRLRVSGPNGEDERTRSGYISVYNLANFSASDSFGLAPLTVHFTDRTDGVPTWWEWDFQSDGIPDSQAQNPDFTYSAGGSYSVRLRTVVQGETLQVVKPNYIRAQGSATLLIDPTTIGSDLSTPIPFAYWGTAALGAISAFVEWDPAKLVFDGVESRTPGEVFYAGIVGGRISVQWYDQSGGDNSIPPAATPDTLFVLLFHKAVPTGVTQLTFYEPDSYLADRYGNPLSDAAWLDEPPYGVISIDAGCFVSGRVGYYWQDRPVPGAVLSLGPPPPDVTSGDDGSYEFLSCPEGDRTLTIGKDGDGGGINALDAIKVIRHSIGIEPLTDPYKLIAADVNGIVGINALDAIKIVRAAVGLESLASGDWRFEPPAVVYEPLDGDRVADFVSIRMGDVNGDWTTGRGSEGGARRPTAPVGLTQTGLRSAAADEERTAITLTLPEVYMDPQGGDQQLPLLVTGFVQVGAVSLRINFSGQVVEYRDVVSKVPGVTFTRNLVGEEIRVEWYDGSGGAHPISIGTDTLLAVVFRPQGQPGATSPVMFGQECMLGDAQGNPISGVQYSDGSVTLGNPAEVPEHGGPAAIFDFRVAGTGMRPEAIEFLYSIPKAAEVSIRLDDVAGRQIGAFVCSDATPGRYRVRLADVAGTPLPGSGVYFARFQAGPYQRTAKFVTLR